jgi:hypothetical protein
MTGPTPGAAIDYPIISRHLSNDGTATGTKNANGNYATPTRFYIQPAAGEIFVITRLIVAIYDTGGMQTQEYGNLGGPLANGVTVQLATNGVQTKDLCDGVPVKYNGDWARMCHDADVKSWGAGNDHNTIRWTFARSGTDVVLDGDSLESLDVVLNDDFTGLISHYFLIQGYQKA